METAAITQYVDVAQIVLYLFWAFFFGLVVYLQRESHREGYPMESGHGLKQKIAGWPIARPKTYLLPHGGSVQVPPGGPSGEPPLNASPGRPGSGAPLEPHGDPMQAFVGPGSYALRADHPDLTMDGDIKIVPLRVASDHGIAPQDRDPRGLPVVGADGVVAGHVSDLWVDRAEMMFRYLEVDAPGSAHGPHILVPMAFAKVRRDRIEVDAVLGHQLDGVPRTRHPDRITLLEEEKVCAYYGAGTLYATPARQEPLV